MPQVKSEEYRSIGRKVSSNGGRTNHLEYPDVGSELWFLREIAAQLAEQNERLVRYRDLEAASHLRVALLQIEDEIVKEHVSEALRILEE